MISKMYLYKAKGKRTRKRERENGLLNKGEILLYLWSNGISSSSNERSIKKEKKKTSQVTTVIANIDLCHWLLFVPHSFTFLFFVGEDDGSKKKPFPFFVCFLFKSKGTFCLWVRKNR
jgi:hypothetical protein